MKKIPTREPEQLKRGKAFQSEVQANWREETSGDIQIEKSQVAGRMDLFTTVEDGDVVVIEIKSTNWDRIKPSNVRKNLNAHRRQLMRYFDTYYQDGDGVGASLAMIYPNVPVILMTAQGSEAIAIDALNKGASSYVPKSQLNEILLETVEQVLALARADRTYTRLMECQNSIEFSYSLDNDVKLIDALIDLIQQILEGMRFTDHTGKFRLGVAVREALMNAMYRGNLEITFEDIQKSREGLLQGLPAELFQERRFQPPYCDRRIHVEARVDAEEARFVVRDEGKGFDFTTAANSGDLSSIESLEAKNGRGLVLMRSFMDEVTFVDSGNQVTLTKRSERDD